MPRSTRQGPQTASFLTLALCGVAAACFEPARSADVPPGAAERLSANAKAAALAKAETAKHDPSSQPAAHADFEQAAFFGEADGPVLQALAHEAPVRIEKGRGGRSLGFRITLAGGQKGYFKAEQTFSAANWFGEVGAYHLDRMLGLGRVPAVISRTFPWARLAPAAGTDPRRSEVIVRSGEVRGAFVAWVTGVLRPMDHQDGWERWVRMRYWPSTAVSPFQRPAVWKREIDLQKQRGSAFRDREERMRRRNLKPEPDRPDRPAELSDLIVFDYLTRNIDRWGGDNANVLVRGEGAGPLIFLDNGAGFEPGEARPSLMEARLHVVSRFRRRTIAAVRAFDLRKFEERLAREPVTPVLGRAQLDGLEARRKALLEWVSAQEAAHGEAIWAWE